jgi:hypothetical protein
MQAKAIFGPMRRGRICVTIWLLWPSTVAACGSGLGTAPVPIPCEKPGLGDGIEGLEGLLGKEGRAIVQIGGVVEHGTDSLWRREGEQREEVCKTRPL